MSRSMGMGPRGTVRNRITHAVLASLLCAVLLVLVGGLIRVMESGRAASAEAARPLLALRRAPASSSTRRPSQETAHRPWASWTRPAQMLLNQPSHSAGYVADAAMIPAIPRRGFAHEDAGRAGGEGASAETGGDAQPPAARSDDATFNGRSIRPARTLHMRVTAYSPDARSCGSFADGVTASGYSVWTNGMKLVAADTRELPFGSIVSIPGYDGGRPVPVLDRGGAIRGRRLDVLYPTHERALQWGVQEIEVTVWEYVD